MIKSSAFKYKTVQAVKILISYVQVFFIMLSVEEFQAKKRE